MAFNTDPHPLDTPGIAAKKARLRGAGSTAPVFKAPIKVDPNDFAHKRSPLASRGNPAMHLHNLVQALSARRQQKLSMDPDNAKVQV